MLTKNHQSFSRLFLYFFSLILIFVLFLISPNKNKNYQTARANPCPPGGCTTANYICAVIEEAEDLPHKNVDDNRIKFSDYLKLKDGQPIAEVYDQPGKIINLVVRNLFVVAGIIIFFLFIGAGFSYIKDSGQGKEEAKNLVTGAVVGFLIMFCAYWIVQIIKFITGTDIPI